MELSKDALEFVSQQAVAANGPHTPIELDEHFVKPQIILAEGQKLLDVEGLMAGRGRFRGTLVTASLQDFAGYIRRREASASKPGKVPVFIDAAKMTAKAFFNLGHELAPGHGDDTAQLALERTAPFAAVMAFKGQRHDQKAVAEFIEDWRAHITAFSGFDEDGALVGVSLSKAIAGVRQIEVDQRASSNSVVSDMASTVGTLESVEARSANGIPVALGFRCVPYEGLAEVNLILRVSVITAEKPALVLRIVREGDELEKIAQDFKRVLAEGIEAQADLTVGVFTP